MLGINYEIRPDKTFDPFIGLAGGIYYTIVTQTAQNVSNLGSNPVGATSMTSNDLLVKATKVLPAAAARLAAAVPAEREAERLRALRRRLADEKRVNPYLRFEQPSIVALLAARGLPVATERDRWRSLMSLG